MFLAGMVENIGLPLRKSAIRESSSSLCWLVILKVNLDKYVSMYSPSLQQGGPADHCDHTVNSTHSGVLVIGYKGGIVERINVTV